MQIVNFHPHNNQVGARGDCPHCTVKSYFRPVSTYIEPLKHGMGQRIVSAAECEACNNFVLVVGHRGTSNGPFTLTSVLPLGQPKDQVDSTIPANIASDFKEALRCQWVSAYKACVVMCRRAIQASAIELGAKGNKLIDQIDDLRVAGKITESLREFAHEVRLTGNDGAHPDKDGLNDVAANNANDIVEFTRDYLQHVYVMPAKLKARKPSSAVAAASKPTGTP